MNRTQFLKVLAKHGAELDTETENYDLNVDAAKGKVFRANGCHCITEPFSNNCNQSWKAEAYAEVIKRVEMGLDDCDDPSCDICNPEPACTCDQPDPRCPRHDTAFQDGEL